LNLVIGALGYYLFVLVLWFRALGYSISGIDHGFLT
jgi:hypothetical protein